jgi:dimeric dUTPase (all-alpha-NTP-PPase superfamily)
MLYRNILDIVYCHTEEQAKEIFDFYIAKGHKVGVSTVEIETGTRGKCVVKKIDIYK